MEEKITLEANRDGGLEHMEVRGTMWLIISKAECDKVQVKIEKDDSKGLLFQVRRKKPVNTSHLTVCQTHPNIDKKAFTSNSIIALKAADKSFPLQAETAVLKWRVQGSDESSIPLTSMHV